MPKRTDIRSILIIGAGPIVIGQACEFDYSGAQACKALREEGYRVILINSNPATIMTDPSLADATYIEPITPETVERIIMREKPDALLPTMGGQTALNTALALDRSGALARLGVELIGAKAEVIDRAEDRLKFRDAMTEIGIESPKSAIAHTLAEAREALAAVGLPAVIRPSFTLGGTLIIRPSSSGSSPAVWTRAPPPRCSSRRACSAGKSMRWRSSATARIIASSYARSRMWTRWASIPATA
jgi:carbamoyl-phosphate synthase large subunit